MTTQKAIEQLGYKPSEAKVYDLLLQTGETTASYIAFRVKLPRTSVQLILDRLHRDGLVNFYTKKRYKYWVAENPQRLLTIVKEKETMIQKLLPSLLALQRATGDRPTAHVFIGIEEIRQIFEDILETKHHISAILPWDEWVKLCGEEQIEAFDEQRIEQYLQLQLLVPKTINAAHYRSLDTAQLRKTKFLPSRIAIATAMLIYDKRVAIVTLNRKQPTGIILHDADISVMMKEIFEELWNSSS